MRTARLFIETSNVCCQYFSSNFNISFSYPKTDTCSTSDEIQLRVEYDATKALIVQQRDIHLCKAEWFYNSLRSDTRFAKESDHFACITFDFEQNFPLPSIPVGEVFYMHQLWLYLFGIRNCGSNDVCMYCWPETIAGRRSDEVVSCLPHYLNSLPESITTLSLYSDGCGGKTKTQM